MGKLAGKRGKVKDTFSDRITILINENDLSQQEAAEKIGCSRSAVRGWLDGEICTGRHLIAISSAFGVSADWLLGLSNNRKRR